MLMPLAVSRNAHRCLSSAFGSFWRAAKRNSPESAQRVAKSKLILLLKKNHTTTRVAKLKSILILDKEPHHSPRGEIEVDFKTPEKPTPERGRIQLS